jgi:predicted nuclease of predicted toxin-antitoxin system
MKVLLDSCVWGGAVAELKAAGHDVIWTGEWPKDPGDEEILKHAHDEQRILVTLDKDFGEIAILHKAAHQRHLATRQFLSSTARGGVRRRARSPWR